MRRISTLKTFVFSLLSAVTLTASVQTQAQNTQDCNIPIVETFTGDAGGFTSGRAFYENNSLRVPITNDIGGSVTSAEITSRPFAYAPGPNGTIAVGFRLSGYTRGSSYRIEVRDAVNPNIVYAVYPPTGFEEVNPDNGNTNRAQVICHFLTPVSVAPFPGTPIIFVVRLLIPDPRGEGNNELEVRFDDFRTLEAAGAPLPVKFKSVNAKKANAAVQVSWEVAEETDVVRYDVERSVNGKDYSKIGDVAATGKSSYSFTDNAPVNGVGFYRIRNVDADGQAKYSSVVRLNLNNAVALKAFPLPANSQVTVEHGIPAAAAALSITTLDGKMIVSQQVARGASYTNINTSTLKAGIYLLRYDQGNGVVETLKLVKQ